MHIPPFAFQSRTNGCGERWKASLGAGLVLNLMCSVFAGPESDRDLAVSSFQAANNSRIGKLFPQRLKPFSLQSSYVRAKARTLQENVPQRLEASCTWDGLWNG